MYINNNILKECTDKEINSPDGETEQSQSPPDTIFDYMHYLAALSEMLQLALTLLRHYFRQF